MTSDSRTSTTRPSTPAENGVYLFVKVARHAVTVRQITPIERAPRTRLREPLLTRERAGALPRSASELVLIVIERDGTIVESFGWPAEAEVFVDRVDPKTGDFIGGPIRTSEWDARLRIPVRESARYLFFYRTDLVVDRERRRAISYVGLGLIDLMPSLGGDLPPLPVPWPYPPLPAPLPPWHFPRPFRWELKWLDRFRPVLAPSGYVKDARTIIDTGDPADRFDIVILGDGFTEAELGTFDYYADLLAEGLTSTAPFSAFSNRISVHAVRVVSTDSGISSCPAADEGTIRRTYFKTTGFWNGEPSPSFIGTSWTTRIFDAVDTIIPQVYADLVITIVNCRVHGGGSAPPELGLVFLTLSNDDETFVNVAAHEAAHVVAGVCEEYNSCTAKDPLRSYPNEATKSEVDADAVWWKTLADPTELDGAGAFKVVHDYGDGDAPHEYLGRMYECQPDLPPDEYEMLGAFWGGQNGDGPNTAAGTARYCHNCGTNFYRPMAECKMRRLRYEFCRVCSTLISAAIRAIAP